MSQHCKANPCCGDRPCSGIPLPQHVSGLTSHNVSHEISTSLAAQADFNSRSALSPSQSDPAPEIAALREENAFNAAEIAKLQEYFLAAEDAFEYGEVQAPTRMISRLHAARDALSQQEESSV